MRTVCTDVFTFDELPAEYQDDALEKAKERFAHYEFGWSKEWQDSLEKFADAIPGLRLDNWSVGWRTDVTFRLCGDGDGIEDLAGVRLIAWLHNNLDHILMTPKRFWLGEPYKSRHRKSRVLREQHDCPFTAYCGDESFLDPIRKHLQQPNLNVTLRDLLEDCFYSGFKSWESDMEYPTTDEGAREQIACEGMEFTVDFEQGTVSIY
jgi:hypothetical protein